MNLVFIGSSKFGLRCLLACLEMSKLKVTGVVTSSQTFAISYRPSGVTNVLYADVAGLANLHAIPVQSIASSMNEPGLFEAVKEWKPDLFLVAGWYHMIPKHWRKLAPAYGLHASLLPDYSGGAPLVWAMINGATRTGISLFQMNDGVDSGPIAGQREERIYPDDTIATLYARIEERGLELLRDVLPQLASSTFKLELQDETKRRTFPQRSPEDGRIDWTKDAASIDRFIRAQTRPYPGAFTALENAPLHIWRSQVGTEIGQFRSECGFVCQLNDGTYTVACGSGCIVINEITYGHKTYTKGQLVEVFGGGGQCLGELPSYSSKLDPR